MNSFSCRAAWRIAAPGLAALFLCMATATPAQESSPSAAVASDSTTATEQDVNFVKSVHSLAEASLAAARLAVVKAEGEPVRKLGRDIIADKTTANEELKRLASQHGIALPPRLSSERRRHLSQLERASGTDFDRAYLALQKEDSGATLRLFEQQAKSGSGPFRSYAETTLPRLQEHSRALSGL